MNSVDRSSPVAEARERLEQELARLRERREELTGALAGRDPVGDRGDNAEDLELAEELVRVRERIAYLLARLSGAQPPPEPEESLPPGAEVTVRYLDDGSVQQMRVVAFLEEIPDGAEDSALTTHSPLGRALAGHRPGEVVTFPTPEGTGKVEFLDLRPPSAS